MPWTVWLKQHLFLIVPEANKLKMKVLVNPVPDEDSLPGLHIATFLLCPYMAEREEGREEGRGEGEERGEEERQRESERGSIPWFLFLFL